MATGQDIHDLVDALTDRTIDNAQAAELNRRLETDPAARGVFLNLMRIEAELGAMHLPLGSRDASIGVASDAELQFDRAEPLSAPHATKRSASNLRLFQLMGALAASVAITAIASSWITYQTLNGRGPLASWAGALATPAPLPAEAVARVAATRNCRWRGDASGLGFGAEVAGGQLIELETGHAELTFADGARLVLEGPAAFRIDDGETIELYQGRVAAAVPSDASRFSVRTPRLVITETGAQFGVVAGADGSDEVHVFEGAVSAKAIDRQGRVTGSVSLSSLEAARFGSASHRFARFNSDDEQFVRSLDTRNEPGDGLLAFEDFSYPTGPVAWQNGGFGWVGPWSDLEAAPGEREFEGAAPSNGVVRGSMSAADLVALGNRFVQSGNANRVRRTLSTSIGGVFDAAGYVENVDGLRLIGRDGSTLYFSFLQRVSKTDDVFYGFELHRGDGNFNRVLCIGNGADGNGYGVSKSFRVTGAKDNFASLGEENDGVNFFVVRIDFGPNDHDTATVYRNPSSLSEEASCVPTATLRGMMAFDRVSLGNFEGSKLHEIDEVRIGTDFGAVTRRRGAEWAGVRPSDLAQIVLPIPMAYLTY